MEMTSVLGVLLGMGLIGFGLVEGQLLSIFINGHGISLVIGGTLAATMISTPGAVLKLALRELRGVFFPARKAHLSDIAAALVTLAHDVRRDGMTALQRAPSVKDDGFLDFAVRAALEKNDVEKFRMVLENGMRQREGTLNRAAGVFQSMAFLSPMFGLLGTIIGIVGVLKEISNPQAIGPAMAVAITTAFYGILLAALFCNPIAIRIRGQAQEERRMRELVMVGMLDILSGAIPLEVSRNVQAYVEG